jgi:toxin ParE1/3/4
MRWRNGSYQGRKMLYNITFSDDAEDDMLAAYIWYERQKKGLGKEFNNEVKNAAASIQSNPSFYSFRMENVRACATKRFPYLILFFVDGKDIRVISVMHTSRKPKI